MTLLTCVQTSSTMSTCIININNNNPASPPLPPHLNSDNDNDNDNSCYHDHHDHPYHQQQRPQQKGSRHITSQALRYVFIYIFLFLNKLLTNIYILDRLPPPNGCHITVEVIWQLYPTQLSCKGPIGWRKGREKGWGSRRNSSQAPGMFFYYLFFWTILIVSCI